MRDERLADEIVRLKTSTMHLVRLAAQDPAVTDTILRLAATIDNEAETLEVLIGKMEQDNGNGKL